MREHSASIELLESDGTGGGKERKCLAGLPRGIGEIRAPFHMASYDGGCAVSSTQRLMASSHDLTR